MYTGCKSGSVEDDAPSKWKAEGRCSHGYIKQNRIQAKKVKKKTHKMLLYDIKGINTSRRYNNHKYICFQHLSIEIHEAINNGS